MKAGLTALMTVAPKFGMKDEQHVSTECVPFEEPNWPSPWARLLAYGSLRRKAKRTQGRRRPKMVRINEVIQDVEEHGG
jgi:hypothetical protein